MFKIRLTDSITLMKFTILKPEVEMVYDSLDVSHEEGIRMTEILLDKAVDSCLDRIARRMDSKQKRAVLADVSADPRFVEKIKETI